MARAILTDAERVGWERFPADPDAEAIGAYFTLADGEVDALRRLPTPAARLASAVALAGIRWLGFVPAELDQAPAAGVERLASQLDIDPAVLVGYVPAERTAREHRQRAAQPARFRDPRGEDLDALEDLLVERALEHDSPLGLLRGAVLALRGRLMLRPALSTLERLVTAARARAERETFERLEPVLDDPRGEGRMPDRWRPAGPSMTASRCAIGCSSPHAHLELLRRPVGGAPRPPAARGAV